MELKLIAWTAALVIGLGGISMSALLQPPKGVTLEKRVKPPVLTAHTTETNPSKVERSPASLDGEGARVVDVSSGKEFSSVALDANTGHQALEFAMPCGKTKYLGRFDPAVKQIRIVASSCSKTDQIASSEVRNEANGFSATVFKTSAHTFTTDYLSLAPGENRIRILLIYEAGGREERELLISRL